MSFWTELASKKSILALAPMEDVTDTSFRKLILEIARPDVLFTEFTSSEGVQSEGKQRVIHRLKFDKKKERPIVAQIWGVTPEDYYHTAQMILEMNFDGIDINMGCPVKKIVKQGACSALIKNPNLAKEITLAVKEGVKDKIPVSIKTRIGFNKIQTEEWIGFLLQECKPEVITIHGRTAKEMSKTSNNWEEIFKTVKLREVLQKDLTKKTLILGNGDIRSYQEAQKKIEENHLDGVMIGRGVFYNLWIFDPKSRIDKNGSLWLGEKLITKEDRINLLRRHIEIWISDWSLKTFDSNLSKDPNTNRRYIKNFAILKRFFKIYISGFSGAGDLRSQLMQTNNHLQVLEILD